MNGHNKGIGFRKSNRLDHAETADEIVSDHGSWCEAVVQHLQLPILYYQLDNV